MGESQFLYIKAAKSIYEEFPWYLRRSGFQGSVRENWRWKYLWRKFPYTQREFEVLGRKGMEIVLPFTAEELEEKDGGIYSDILYRLQVETGISYIAVEKRIEHMFEFERVCDGKMLPLYMAEKIIDEIGSTEKISRKNIHIALLAGDDIYTLFLLKKLGSLYNYLTLAAADESPYREMIQNLYDEYGIAVSFVRMSASGSAVELSGDIFIDLTGKDNRSCRMFPKEAKVLDLLGEKDIRYYQGKRGDIRLFNGFSFGKKREIPAGLIQAALGQESSWLMKGALEDYSELVKNLDLRVLALKSCFS